MAEISKTERLLNLISYLLKAREPVSWKEIAGQVIGYDDPASPKSLERRFERDKLALKQMGIPITYYHPCQFGHGGYLIPRDRYYLQRLDLLPHEALLLRLLGSIILKEKGVSFREDLQSALQKLRFDSPSPPESQPADGEAILFTLPFEEDERLSENLELLSDALLQNRRVSFTYYTIERDETLKRLVDPYGLGYYMGTWYLVGYSHRRGDIRLFKLNRIRDRAVIETDPGAGPDFQIPEGFDVTRHMGKPSWELGEGETMQARVTFHRDIAWYVLAEVEGEGFAQPTADGGMVLSLLPRRKGAFLRWLLRYIRYIEKIESEPLLAELRDITGETLALYTG